MQKALLAAVFLSVITGFYLLWWLPGISAFIGTGIAHIAFGGIALGLFDLDPYLVSLVFCLAAGGVIAFFSFRKISTPEAYRNFF